jgi:hypothetical protein
MSSISDFFGIGIVGAVHEPPLLFGKILDKKEGR